MCVLKETELICEPLKSERRHFKNEASAKQRRESVPLVPSSEDSRKRTKEFAQLFQQIH